MRSKWITESKIQLFTRNFISRFAYFKKLCHPISGGINFLERGSLMSIQFEGKAGGAISARNASTELDCETAALLRAAIRPVFSSAISWSNLTEILKDKGYRLAFRQGLLCITDRTTGDRVCGLRFLGFDFKDLVRQLGRPIVVARGNEADGDVLSARPTANGV